MEKRFNVSGTYGELKHILKKEFKISDDAARIATAMFIFEQNEGQRQSQSDEGTFWFLDSKQPDYQASICSTRYTISFTQAMLDIFDEKLVPLIIAACGGELKVLGEALYCIQILLKHVRRIKDNECCVYFLALKCVKGNRKQWFTVDQVTPHIGDEAICINLDKNWQCRFKCGESRENCKIHMVDVKNILDTFCKDGIMEPNDMGTLYKFKF